jgi:hypothetical protein
MLALAGGPLHAAPPLDPPPSKDVLVVNPESQPVPVTGQVEVVAPPLVTHMGQAPEDHVQLGLAAGSGFTCPTGTLSTLRVLSDAQPAFAEFVVPDGRSFVLTDFGIPVSEAPGFAWNQGSIVTLHVMIGVAGSASLRTVWQTSAHVDQNLALSRQTWLEAALTSGVVIGPGQRICIGAGFGFQTGTNATVSVPILGRLYGYLVDN